MGANFPEKCTHKVNFAKTLFAGKTFWQIFFAIFQSNPKGSILFVPYLEYWQTCNSCNKIALTE